MMRTTVAVLAGAGVAALVTFLLVGPASSPSPPPAETREAVVFLDDRADCQPKTLPKTLFARVRDSITWDIQATAGCAAYADDLEIRVKKGEDPADLPVDDGQPGPSRKGRVAKKPAKCKPGAPCFIDYTVIVKGSGGSKQEDPRVDIWP